MTLTFHLPDLPTAQHKAGLAGLVLQVGELRERAEEDDSIDDDELPELREVSPLSATITLTERSTRRLFDELYYAKTELVTVKSKWQGQSPTRPPEKREEIDPATGKARTVTYFTYEVVTPRNPFLMRHVDNELWQKLWRDMLFNIPRAKPTTRIPYNERAAGKPCSEGGKVWKELLQFAKSSRKNEIRTTSVSGALLLGAQDVSAENVPFQDRSDHALLLHFWPLTALVFVPWLIKVDAADPAASKEEGVGYALAIPEVSDLEEFCEAFPKMLHHLAGKTEKKGYRPRAACIDLPEQSALEFMENFPALVGATIAEKRQALRRRINSVEYRHLIKAGNNVKSLSGGRVVSDPDLLRRYDAVRDGYKNPLFRATLLRALLRSPPGEYERRWFAAFEETFRTMPHEFFVRGGETPPAMRSFPADADARFRAVHEAHRSHSEDAAMPNQTASPAPPEVLILQMVRNFLRQKAGEKCGIPWDSFRDRRVPIEGQEGKTRVAVPPEFREAQEQIATETFLAIRSRRGHDFADYFTARICAASQRHLNDKDDFLTISRALLQNSDDVKTLTLLALSACS